jgi:hypothetical protein
VISRCYPLAGRIYWRVILIANPFFSLTQKREGERHKGIPVTGCGGP